MLIKERGRRVRSVWNRPHLIFHRLLHGVRAKVRGGDGGGDESAHAVQLRRKVPAGKTADGSAQEVGGAAAGGRGAGGAVRELVRVVVDLEAAERASRGGSAGGSGPGAAAAAGARGERGGARAAGARRRPQGGRRRCCAQRRSREGEGRGFSLRLSSTRS